MHANAIASARSRGGPPKRYAGATSGQVYLSVREAAIRTGVTTRTIKRWIAAGFLPANRLPSPKGRGHLRIRVSDLEILVARGSQS